MIESEEAEVVSVVRFIPSGREIDEAEWIVLDRCLLFCEADRRLLFARFGRGYVRSYRKLSGDLGLPREYIRQEIQRVMKQLKEYLDEK